MAQRLSVLRCTLARPMPLRAALICLVGLALACTRSDGPGQSHENSSCSASELAAWLEDVRADGLEPGLIYPLGLRLAALESDRDPDRGPIILISHDVVTLNGEAVVDVTAPDPPSLADLRERLELVAGAPVTVGVDKELRWDQVVPLIRAVGEAGRRSIALLGERPYRARAPRPPALDAHLEEVAGFDESRRAARVREQAWHERVYARCPPALGLFEAEDAALAATLEALPAAIERCSCAVEADAVEVHVWGLAGRIRRPARLVVVEVELAGEEGSGSTTLALAPDTPWSSAIERLTETRGPVHVTVQR
jgi:hypothetical protein